ncbi:MAG: hypothetical protein P8Y06_02730, partial [Patescibacteria group bacterium]
LMSWKHLGSILKIGEGQKGGFKVRPDSMKASEYGWTSIEIGSVSGVFLKIVGIQELDDDVIFFMDWKALKLHTNGLVRKHKDPEGKEFYGAKERQITIEGVTEEGVSLTINDRVVAVDEDGGFAFSTTLGEGENNFNIKSADKAGNQTEMDFKVSFTP